MSEGSLELTFNVSDTRISKYFKEQKVSFNISDILESEENEIYPFCIKSFPEFFEYHYENCSEICGDQKVFELECDMGN